MKKIFTLALFVFIFNNIFSQVSPVTYTTPGTYTYTVPAGVNTITIEVVGAGGSGGGNGTGGGGGGGYASGVYTVVPTSTYIVKVGTGGGGAATGSTSVGALIFATAGINGITVANPIVGGGGVGGIGTNGTIANRTGGTGGGGYFTYFGGGGAGSAGSLSNGLNGGNVPMYTGTNCLTPGGTAGGGGGAPGGAGGKGAGFTNSICSVTNPAANGTNFGGGGGGGNGIGSTPGIGAGGYCQISWGAGCVPPAPPTNVTLPPNLILCSGNNTTLTALGSGTVSWFTTPSGTVVVGTGINLVTPTLTNTITYYAEAFTCAPSLTRTAITITVNPNPTVTAITNASVICVGQTAVLTASGAATYSWTTGGATATIAVSPTVTTTYTVTGTTTGCKNVTVITQSVSTCAGLAETQLQKPEINIFPNPFNNKITVVISKSSETTLQIFNLLGSLIYISKFENLKSEIDLSKEPSGIYFVRINTTLGQVTKKVIKE